ncbi:glycosyltransferase family 2 protein [Candidatus Kaiserbacteria bacterium]|nr:glycosyltransferase family 2 protein [Candidatus Kaiserbacteria bacterium]
MRQISISIFFPTFNEERNIVSMVERAIDVARQCPYVKAYEIVIIDDGSTDATPALADLLAQRHTEVRTVHHPTNQGYGAALKTGFQEARMQYVFFTDADMQFDLLELEHLVIHVPEYCVVTGYRAPRRDSFMRLVNAKGWNILNRIFFGLRIRDIDCAFKLFERSVIKQIRITSDGAMVNAELLVRLMRRGIPIKEVPVSHLPRIYGSPTGAKPSVIFRAIRELLSLYMSELGSASLIAPSIPHQDMVHANPRSL